MSDPLAKYQFSPQPEPAAWVDAQLQSFLAQCAPAGELAVRMFEETSTRFADWVERLTLPEHAASAQSVSELGFRPVEQKPCDPNLYAHPEGMFPVIELGGDVLAVSLRVASLADFCAKNSTMGHIQGEPGAATRRVLVCEQNGGSGELGRSRLWATERHRGRFSTDFGPVSAEQVEHVLEAFLNRKRDDEDETRGFERARELVVQGQHLLGADYTCDLFFEAERRYWESRNEAARLQKARQDALGLGWGNHDHHTYRSSREHFRELVVMLELLGLRCRERFYAGREAGWGAQVLEQPRSGLMVFADVDLQAQEVMGDFAHDGLAGHDELGTVGLWCKLHGEAFLQAGLHHLEAQFDFTQACQQLEPLVGVMPPFTDFTYLKQCFTNGQLWPVSVGRLQQAVQRGWIDQRQAEAFKLQGALGSHLEILERNDGYQGFNQTGISEIITRTDPRGRAAE